MYIEGADDLNYKHNEITAKWHLYMIFVEMTNENTCNPFKKKVLYNSEECMPLYEERIK